MERQNNNFRYHPLLRGFYPNRSNKNYYNNQSIEKTTNYPNEDLGALGINHYGFLLPLEETKRKKSSKLEKISEQNSRVGKIIQKVRKFIYEDTSYGAFIK